jgi:hypothetical protein
MAAAAVKWAKDLDIFVVFRHIVSLVPESRRALVG